MERRDFEFLSKDMRTRIHAVEWIPDQEVKAVLQICHGMIEHIARYDDFARFLTSKGVLVTGHDHLGHGNSVSCDAEYGYFPEKNGNQCVIGDIHTLRTLTKKKYPDVPYFMLGHSMGSFLLRQYMTLHGEGLAGAIVMGTGHQPMAILTAGQAVCKSIGRMKGWKHRSKLVDDMAFGSYNKKFEPAKTSKDWLTSDEELLDMICAEPLWSSNPQTYIDANASAFQTMVSFGRGALRYCFRQFLEGGQNDLRGHIMAAVCKEIMQGWGEAYLVSENAWTGQTWFDQFLANTRSLSALYSREELEKLYPGATILLETMHEYE